MYQRLATAKNTSGPISAETVLSSKAAPAMVRVNPRYIGFRLKEKNAVGDEFVGIAERVQICPGLDELAGGDALKREPGSDRDPSGDLGRRIEQRGDRCNHAQPRHGQKQDEPEDGRDQQAMHRTVS
eukprot:jgi/Tetstr1/446587/TSEL_034112.t1